MCNSPTVPSCTYIKKKVEFIKKQPPHTRGNRRPLHLSNDVHRQRSSIMWATHSHMNHIVSICKMGVTDVEGILPSIVWSVQLSFTGEVSHCFNPVAVKRYWLWLFKNKGNFHHHQWHTPRDHSWLAPNVCHKTVSSKKLLVLAQSAPILLPAQSSQPAQMGPKQAPNAGNKQPASTAPLGMFEVHAE